jgi:hypothetical protein
MHFHQVTPSSIIVLRSLQNSVQQHEKQQPTVCWSAPQGHTIVLASFAGPVVALVTSHFGSGAVVLLNFSDSTSPPKTTATFPCEQSAALRCTWSCVTCSCIIAVATYVQNELHMWHVDIEGGAVQKVLSTKLPELLLQQSAPRDAAVDSDSIINCIWMQRHADDASSAGIDVYLGSRSGVLHKLFCDTAARATRVLNSWRLSESPLEFVFVGGSESLRDELLVVGEGQWLVDLKPPQPSQQQVQPVVATHQTFEGACNACTFRSPSTPYGVIVSLRSLPQPLHSSSGPDVGGAVIMTLPSVECGSSRVCKVTTLSQININAACSHVAVLPRLSLTIVGALIHNRASLLFICQGRVVHSRPLISAGGGTFVSLDAREDQENAGRFTIVFSLAGGQHGAVFNVSREDFTLFECSDGMNFGARSSTEERAVEWGMTEIGESGGAVGILRACMKSKIEEGEKFYCGNVRPAAAKVEVRIVFDEPFYQRCARGEQVQGAGILSLAGAGDACTGSHVVVASVSGKTRAFSPDNAVLEVQCVSALCI